MARRKNASFTGAALSGHGSGSRELVEAFYDQINKLIPGSTPVPIPPLESVHPKHDERTQIFIFADYAVRKFAPIALDALRRTDEANNLRSLKQVWNESTAAAAYREAAGAAITAAARARAADPAYAADAADAAASAAYDAPRAAYAYGDDAFAASAADLPKFAAYAACNAAKLNPDATWEAVNEMLAAL